MSSVIQTLMPISSGRHYIIASLVVMSLLLAACPGGRSSATPTPVSGAAPAETPTTAAQGAAPAANASAQSGTIRISVVRGAMIDTMRKLADKYMQSHPGVKVNVEEEPEGGAFEALIAAGNQPDMIVTSFGSQIGHLAAGNAVVALEELPGATDLFARLDKATVEQLYGHNYYVPVGADVTMMIYNKELFQQAGLDPNKPPVTWDEFLADAAKIDQLPAQASGDKIRGTVFWNDALTYGGWYWNVLQPIYLNGNQNHCLLLNRLGTDIVFDQPACNMAGFFDFTQKAQKFAPPTMEKNFFSRTIGMWPQYGYSWEPNLKTAANKPMVIGEDVGVAPVPVPKQGDTSFTTYGGRAFMILKTTPERQLQTWDFVQFLMQDENNLVFLKELGYLPILTALKQDAYFQDPARQPFVQALTNAVLPQQFDAADKAAVQIQAIYQSAVVQGQLTPEQAVQQAAQKARDALKAQ